MIDHSSLQTYRECPYRYRLAYLEGLKKREEGEAEHHANFGGAIHKGLEAHYKGGSLEQVLESFQAAYPVQLDQQDLAKTQANGRKLLQEYIRFYTEEDKRYEIVAVEVVDSFEISFGIPYTVKLDLIVKHKSSGEFYGIDHKTTGKSLDYNYWVQFDPNAQLTGYCAYIQHRYGSCSGMYVNALSFGYRQRAYRGEPPGFHWNFQRQLFNRNKHQIEAWKEDTIGWIEDLSYSKENNRFYKNTSQCRWCSYRPICMAEWTPEKDGEQIGVLYEKVEDPMAYLKEIR